MFVTNSLSFEKINDTFEKLNSFVSKDNELHKDFNDYIQTISEENFEKKDFNYYLANFLSNINYKETGKTILDYCVENNIIDKEEKNIASLINNTISSIFEVKKFTRNTLELFNLVNEKTYKTSIIEKVVNYRNILTGSYIVARIFKSDDTYYLYQLKSIISSINREDALKFALMFQMQNPPSLYFDNSEKLEEVRSMIKNMGSKFKEFFNTDEVITSSNNADDVLNLFNDYIDTQGSLPENSEENKNNLEELLKQPDQYEFFEIKNQQSQNFEFGDILGGGFSSQERNFDIGIIFDEELGLFVLPFYATFQEIFNVQDYKSIPGYKECIINYVTGSNVPPFPLIKAYNKNNEKFISIINETLEPEEKINDLQQLLDIYKSQFIKEKKLSSTTILYSSKVFNQIMESSNFEEYEGESIDFSKVGRNDSCPCGSGKKYKKCCLN